MKLLFKQRTFSWFDNYDVYDESGAVLFTVEGKFSWGHCLHVLDTSGQHIGIIQERLSAFRPSFEFYVYGEFLGCLKKEFTLFTPRFVFDCSDWRVEESWSERFSITSPTQGLVAMVNKNLSQWSYIIDVEDPDNALCALMAVLSVDAEKYSRK